MSKVKLILSNGFRDHSVALSTELLALPSGVVAGILNSFAVGVLEELGVEIGEVVGESDVTLAVEHGRCGFRMGTWLVEIYVESL